MYEAKFSSRALAKLLTVAKTASGTLDLAPAVARICNKIVMMRSGLRCDFLLETLDNCQEYCAQAGLHFLKSDLVFDTDDLGLERDGFLQSLDDDIRQGCNSRQAVICGVLDEGVENFISSSSQLVIRIRSLGDLEKTGNAFVEMRREWVLLASNLARKALCKVHQSPAAGSCHLRTADQALKE
jgi:hypothetical protein